MMMRRGLAVLLCLWNVACWDFIEPDLAAEDGAAVLQMNASVDRAGNLSANATLSPGIDQDGFRRRVSRDTLRVLSFATASDTILRNGFHLYALTARVDTQAIARGITVQGPSVEGVAFTPTARWYVPRKTDPDTLRIARGTDLFLHMAQDTIMSVPRASEQWSVELSAGQERFQISASGRPPAELRVPAEWIPAPSDSVVQVFFTSFQSTQVISADYRAFMTFSTSTNWTVIIR